MIIESELKEIKGGVNWVIVGVGGSIISFIIGLVDGYLRPLKCRKNNSRRKNVKRRRTN